MKSKLLCLAFTLVSVVFTNPSFAANCSSAPAGQYCKRDMWPLAYQLYTCPAGCYCTGANGNFTWWKNDVINGCRERWGKITTELNKYGVNLCPADFSSSASGAKNSSDCYYTSGSKKIYYKKITCQAGKYLPKDSDTCQNCTTGNVCRGVSSVYPNRTKDQGIDTCAPGSQPNSQRTACVANAQTYTCVRGEYLPANSTTCAVCPAGKVCEGGTFEKRAVDQGVGGNAQIKCSAGEYLPANSVECAACPAGKLCLGGSFEKHAIDQGDDDKCPDKEIINPKGSGCLACPKGQEADASHLECVMAKISVNPGFYLPADSDVPRRCVDVQKFCPGGKFEMTSTNQGIYDCPDGARASSDRTGCSMTLTKEQMKYGMKGIKSDDSLAPCWTMQDPIDYRNCIYGVRFETSAQ